MKNCSVENCKKPVFGRHFCKDHYPKSITKQSLFRAKILKSYFSKKPSIESIDRRNEFFKEVWSKRGHYSEVSGAYLGETISSLYFHHILEKRNYPKAEFDEENIILLTGDEHASVEFDSNKYEEINKKRQCLKLKYNIL